MYDDGKKALLMTKDLNLAEQMKAYLAHRYNLILETSSDPLDVLQRIGSDDDSYEVAILDEHATGLTTASQLFKTIKDQDISPTVMYLATLREIVDPAYRQELKILPHYSDEIYRLEQNSMRVGKMLSLFKPLFESKTIKDVCQNSCQSLVETLKADCALCVLPKFDVEPPVRGTVAANYPDLLTEPYEIQLKGDRHFIELADYFKPVHIPDLNIDKAFCRELLERFSAPYRSVLMVPMMIAGKFLGYFGVFSQKSARLFRLVDIDQALRLADFSAAVAVNIFMTDIKKDSEEK